MAELRAYARLKALFPAAHFVRLESWTGVGIPDANGCCQGVEVWVECKEVRKPVRASTLLKPKIRPAQIAWEQQRRSAGGRTFVALMVGKELYLLPGRHLAILSHGLPLTTVQQLSVNHLELFR